MSAIPGSSSCATGLWSRWAGLYDRLADVFVAGFIGSPAMNLMEGVSQDGGLAVADGPLLPIVPPVLGRRFTLGLCPEHLRIPPADAAQGLPATLRSVEPTGSETLLVARVGDTSMAVLAHERIAARPGDGVRLLPDLSQAHWSDAGGRRIAAA